MRTGAGVQDHRSFVRSTLTIQGFIVLPYWVYQENTSRHVLQLVLRIQVQLGFFKRSIQVEVLNISGDKFEDSTFPLDTGFFKVVRNLTGLRSLSIKSWYLSEADTWLQEPCEL